MATTIPVIKLKRGAYTALSSVPSIDGTLYFAQNTSIAGSTAKSDTTERNIFVVDVTSDDGTMTNRRKLDAYRAFYADNAGVADSASMLSTSVAFKIANSDGTGAGTGVTFTGNEGSTGVTLRLPETIVANVTGDLTGNASTASALKVTGAVGSATRPVYINASGVPTQCNETLGVSITGNAAAANTWSVSRNFSISDSGTGTNKHTGTAASVNGSDNVELILPSTITATLNGRANSALKLVNSSNVDIATSNNKAVYFSNGVPVEISGALAHDITGNAASATAATRLTVGAGDSDTPVYINTSGVPTAVSSIDVGLFGDQIIPMKNLPKGVQERLFITSRAANGNAATDALAITTFINSKKNTADPVDAGDVIQITDSDTPNAMYYIYEEDDTLKHAVFTSGAASNAVSAQTAAALDHSVAWQIQDSAATPHSGDATAATTLNSSTGTIILKLPTTITATLNGTADRALRLNNSAAIGSASKPVYFSANGVPVACGDSLDVNAATASTLAVGRTINGTSFDGSSNITTATWGTARTVTISDNDGSNTQANANINGSANFTLKLPATIKATLKGNADTATTASKTEATLALRYVPVSGVASDVGTFNGAKNGNNDITWTLGVDDLFPVHTRTINISTAIAAGTWSTMTAAEPAMTTGTYVVQITTNNKTFNNEVFSGIMSYSSLTGVGGDSDEVLLHSAGADLKGHRIYLRVKRVASGAIQIRYCSDAGFANGDVLTFKFRRIL